MTDPTGGVAVEINCETGEVTGRVLTEAEQAQAQAVRDAAAAADAARQATVDQARQALASNPDLALVMQALGLTLPEG